VVSLKLSILDKRPVRAGAWFLAFASSAVWVFTLADDILYHTPYFFGQWCGAPGLDSLGKGVCSLVYNYYYSLDVATFDLGALALVSIFVTAASLTLLWAPRVGLPRALFRSFLVFIPLAVLVFEALVYFLLNYWWNIHATEFLSGTPVTNEVGFFGALVTLAAALSLDIVLNRSQGAGSRRG